MVSTFAKTYRSGLYRSGFTLVELSVVLVIIGLILGGILVGNTMVRNTELRAIIQEKEQYQAAIVTFQGKYQALPGDFFKASTYFGGTNGDGDGFTWWEGSGATKVHENLKAWQHLTLSGIMPGTYTGLASGYPSIPGTNIPRSRYSRVASWEFFTFNNTAHYGRNEHFLLFGTNIGTNSDIADDAIISPVDAQLFDVKFDDGVPFTGKIAFGNGDNTTGCTNNAFTVPSYYVNTGSVLCRMFFYGIVQP